MFIKSVKMSNYRTIKDTEVEFLPGLNIIIGDNGSGKTNFLDLLIKVLELEKIKSYGSIKCDIEFDNGITLSTENPNLSRVEDRGFNDQNSDFYLFNKEEQKKNEYKFTEEERTKINSIDELNAFVINSNKPSNYVPRVIDHGVPVWPTMLLEIPISKTKLFENRSEFIYQVMNFLSAGQDKYYEPSFCRTLIFGLGILSEKPNEISEKWTAFLNESCRYFRICLKRASPITDVRISPSFHVAWDNDKSELTVRGLSLEFFQNDRWNSYRELSDGTRRLVMLIMSYMDYEEFAVKHTGIKFWDKRSKKIVFIEEPELGINPHQLYRLMLTLKEEARNKQIIITTHSPIALDVLDRQEINSIMLCEYSNEKGTILRRLTERELKKANGYMDEVGYLSLYWSHSDLQKED